MRRRIELWSCWVLALMAIGLTAGARAPVARPTSSDWSGINLEDRMTLQLPSKYPGPVTMDMRDAASGTIGPVQRWIVAVPLNEGGSGGPFAIAIFGIKHHALHLIQEVETGNGGVHALSIRHGFLIAKNYHHLGDDADCCPSGTNTLVFGTPHGYVELLRSWWNLNRATR